MNYGDCSKGAILSGASGCLALTGSGPMSYVGPILIGLSLIFLGIMLVALVKRGTRLPGLRRVFPSKRGTKPPTSPRS